MKGTGLIYRPGGTEPEIHQISGQPTLEWLQHQVGGYIELVPGFVTIELAGVLRDCRTFCNEEGKFHGLPVNLAAMRLWNAALQRQGSTLYDKSGAALDHLVGPILVLYGDARFLAQL
jgi:hypothetical protein